MTKLKAGDRVEYTAGHKPYHERDMRGQKGTFVSYTEAGLVLVDWDVTGRGGPGAGAKFPADVALLEEPKKPEVSQDPEVAAIAAVLATLTALDLEARVRVLDYVSERML